MYSVLLEEGQSLRSVVEDSTIWVVVTACVLVGEGVIGPIEGEDVGADVDSAEVDVGEEVLVRKLLVRKLVRKPLVRKSLVRKFAGEEVAGEDVVPTL